MRRCAWWSWITRRKSSFRHGVGETPVVFDMRSGDILGRLLRFWHPGFLDWTFLQTWFFQYRFQDHILVGTNPRHRRVPADTTKFPAKQQTIQDQTRLELCSQGGAETCTWFCKFQLTSQSANLKCWGKNRSCCHGHTWFATCQPYNIAHLELVAFTGFSPTRSNGIPILVTLIVHDNLQCMYMDSSIMNQHGLPTLFNCLGFTLSIQKT